MSDEWLPSFTFKILGVICPSGCFVPLPPAVSKLLLERSNVEFSVNSSSFGGRRGCRGCQAAIWQQLATISWADSYWAAGVVGSPLSSKLVQNELHWITATQNLLCLECIWAEVNPRGWGEKTQVVRMSWGVEAVWCTVYASWLSSLNSNWWIFSTFGACITTSLCGFLGV